jgi:hypothetical protein
VRYGDAEHKRLTGFSGHGGLIDNGRVRRECDDSLFATIAKVHQIPVERVLQARGARNAVWDVAVMVTFAAFYGLLAWLAVPIIARQFPSDEPWMQWVVLTVAALPVAAGGLLLGDVWSTTMEVIRVGNGHLAQVRGDRIPWGHHLGALFVIGVVYFWFVAGIRIRTRSFQTASIA